MKKFFLEYKFINENIISFFEKRYPLIRLFEYGNDILIYDAKPHSAFIISIDEINILIDFLNEKPEELIIKEYTGSLNTEYIKQLITKYMELKYCGVFIEGPADEISSVDRDVLRKQLEYFNENIVLRKFCLEVTEDCNYRCKYCRNTIATEFRKHSKKYLSEENAFKGIDYFFNQYIKLYNKLSDEKKELLLEIVPPALSWYGGEPFLHFDLVKKSADYFKSLPWHKYSIKKEKLRFSINTNLSIINNEILDFLVDNRIILYASLDGPEDEHNKSRVYKNGKGTFQKAYSNLMKIKKYNEEYFREKVSIYGVYTEMSDYDRCLNYIRSLGAGDYLYFPADYQGVFIPNIDFLYKKYIHIIETDLTDYKRDVSIKAENVENEMNYFSNIMKFFNVNFDNPIGSNFLMTLLTCPMGYDNLMVDANGNFLICHKTDGSMPVGHCTSGLDLEKLIDLYQLYNGTINNVECRTCWNVRFCDVCAARRMTANKFINPAGRECDFLRLQTKYDFLCFIYLSIGYSDIVEKVFDHRNNKRKYISHIDINKL